MKVKVRRAQITEHKTILAVAKQSPYTKDFGAIMFSSEDAYKKGWIRVAVDEEGKILGYTCFRHKSRKPNFTVLYFVTVATECRDKSIGKLLIDDLKQQSPTKTIELNVAKDNRARQFYEREGFVVTGESLEGHGWRMQWG